MNWTVDYGSGPEPCIVPHAWHLDADVRWEGPAVYRTNVEKGVYRFHGVSYRAEIEFDGKPLLTHDGIWDAFDVTVPHAGELTVRVTKNGGETFPVREVASGFLPYVYHTFGGIFRDVEENPSGLLEPPATAFAGSLPFIRGILGWGWYPKIGRPDPDEATIRQEIEAVRDRGFNLVKFCLWLPPHRYLDLLREYGMLGWIELPVWAPAPDRLRAIGEEIGRIVRQYRRHADVVPLWTVGCELGHGVPAEWRERMVAMVKAETGALVKDNSGGSEMYGGDLREYGDFHDFHPYCDTPFYPSVLDSLQNGPREDRPIFLGEFNDIDVHRDFLRLKSERPYWTRTEPALNDRGVRWQYDLPGLLDEQGDGIWKGLFDAGRSLRLEKSTEQKALFMRKFVHEQVRMKEDFRGYVVTGLRDTPISTAGILRDDNHPRFKKSAFAWNEEECLFLIPWRRPSWIHGGNRSAWMDPFNHFEGDLRIQLGSTLERPWRVFGFLHPPEGESLAVREAFVQVDDAKPGEYRLTAKMTLSTGGAAGNSWRMRVWPKPPLHATLLTDPAGLLEGLPLVPEGPTLAIGRDVGASVTILTDEGTLPRPFWREAGYEFSVEPWLAPFAENWEALLAISPDRVLVPKTVGEAEVLIRRIDTRTYEESAVLIQRRDGSLVTTLRPFGGLGCQPVGVQNNPVGWNLLWALLHRSEDREV
ncbi:hypothetical protein EON79_14475 [bacterium]|nr:MAG: hypothetical protein EON79_14475 [bacterium]